MNLIAKPLLSIETATPVCSVALRVPDGRLYEERAEGRGGHSEWTFVFIDRLLRAAGLRVDELGAVLVSAGPGSYTGLRVGSSAVKGLLFDTDVPLFACNTLAGIALGATGYGREAGKAGKAGGPGPMPGTNGDTGIVDAVIDARRTHLYHQSWRIGERGITPETGLKIRELDEVLELWMSGRMLAGTGTDRLMQLAADRGFDSGSLLAFPGSEQISAAAILSYLGYYPDMSAGLDPHRGKEEPAGSSGDQAAGTGDAADNDKAGVHEENSGREEAGEERHDLQLIRRVDPALFEPDYYSDL
ncbi:tRNA (adenosine(37)-N6)-threonylcarbamoyltransferase complex dimerization subunit type 1 TsaB [Balneolales bacterium ANBcel1]|nr:tRNA (adenosine(37)-N6)-threonylcarbamoyltransferase complex dimerization subunit type 1 TsaB [Balneolales bacterium ANBcel1]